DTTVGALQSVYGLDLLGLENAWREAVGLPAFDPNAPRPTPGSQSQTAEPTATPRQSQSQNTNQDNNNGNNRPANTSSASDSDGGSTMVIVLAVLSAALVGRLVAAGLLMWQGRRG